MEKIRKLASIRVINDIRPIEGADKIELATVDGWKVVVAKDVNHKVGDMVVYCEIDSFLPIREEFEFLRKSSYKKMSDGSEGFRLKTIKLRGQISQGLILPLSVLKNYDVPMMSTSKQKWGIQYEMFSDNGEPMVKIGDDVTEVLGIVKYEPPIPAELSGKVKGLFPSFIHKTDEIRIQNLVEEYEEYKTSGKSFYVTEKLDGSSATFYLKDGMFGVCSRNLELLETEGNTFWKVARELNLENLMSGVGFNICLQGELIGEGLQGNPYKIKGQTVRFFNGFNIDKQENIPFLEFIELIQKLGLKTVPILDFDFKLPNTIDNILEYANNKSELNSNFDREGVVIRSYDRTISFKSISNAFLLNE